MVKTHRQQLMQLRSLADSDLLGLLDALAGLPVVDMRNALIQAIPELVAPYVTASGELAAVMFEDLRLEAGRRGVFYANTVTSPLAPERVSSTARWAVSPMVDPNLGSTTFTRLSGSVARMIMDGSRDTMIANGGREKVRFQRMARANACAFCGLLASRPPYMAYTSEAKAAAASHDDCRCVVTALYPGSEMAELASVEQKRWEEKYQQSVSTNERGAVSAKETLAEWRRYHGSK